MIILQRVPCSLKESNSQDSPRGSAVPTLNLSGLVSGCSPCASPASLASSLFHEHAYSSCSLFLKCSSPRYPRGPSPNSFHSLLRRASADHPFILYSRPKRYFQILSTSLSFYRFMYIFPQHLPPVLPLHTILCNWLYYAYFSIVCHYVSLPMRMQAPQRKRIFVWFFFVTEIFPVPRTVLDLKKCSINNCHKCKGGLLTISNSMHLRFNKNEGEWVPFGLVNRMPQQTIMLRSSQNTWVELQALPFFSHVASLHVPQL